MEGSYLLEEEGKGEHRPTIVSSFSIAFLQNIEY